MGWAGNTLKDDNRLQEPLPLAVAEVVIKEQRKGTSAAQLQTCWAAACSHGAAARHVA